MQSVAQDDAYKLQPGDELSLSYLALQPGPHVARIGIDGGIGFPFLGRFQAEGLSLSELTHEIKQSALGIEVPNLVGRDPAFVVLDADDLFLEITQLRPVTIHGHVAQPGIVDFAPGLTVRAAIGARGGVSATQGATATPFEAPAQLNAAMQLRRLLRGQLLKNTILLAAPASVEDIPDADLAKLSEILGEQGAATVLEEVSLGIADRFHVNEALNKRIELVDQRIERLRTAFGNYTSASAAEEERLARVLDMRERGLTTADTVNNIRQAALTASARLLTIESDIFGTQAERARLVAEIERTQNEYRSDLLTQNQELEQDLSQLEGRIEGLQAVLVGTGSTVASQVETIVDVFIYRGSGDDEEERQARMGDLVQPGDVVEVKVTFLEE
ncbi:MAG: polysaccharide biosynthesis/export family protein [Pseudomonadota bacterium]